VNSPREIEMSFSSLTKTALPTWPLKDRPYVAVERAERFRERASTLPHAMQRVAKFDLSSCRLCATLA